MSEGLVYLRPRQLVGLAIRGRLEDALPQAWGKMKSWAMRKSLAGELEVGYGLVYTNAADPDDVNYWAAIEIPESLTKPDLDELARILLPGGAFLRRRHRGAFGAMPAEFSTMREFLTREGRITIDADRPAITVMLNVDEVFRGGEVRSNLLLPACRAESMAA